MTRHITLNDFGVLIFFYPSQDTGNTLSTVRPTSVIGMDVSLRQARFWLQCGGLSQASFSFVSRKGL